MTTSSPRLRQLVDWRAAFWAGLIAGAIFLLVNLFVTPLVIGGNAWVMVRLFASIILGEGILAPPATFDLLALVVALITHFALAVGYSMLIAYIIHRGGLIAGIIGGALLGLALYSINFYTLTFFFPWFFAMRSGAFVAAHLLFGALAGGIYEALEVETFVPANN
jgi:hypothetical protein